MPPGLLAMTPKEVMAGYDPTQTNYQLFVPHSYRLARSSPLILFLSASASPEEFASWAAVCRKYDVLFASPHDAGNNTPAAKRLRWLELLSYLTALVYHERAKGEHQRLGDLIEASVRTDSHRQEVRMARETIAVSMPCCELVACPSKMTSVWASPNR